MTRYSHCRYEASSLEDGETPHREQDFGYEVIDQTAADVSMDEDEEVPEKNFFLNFSNRF